MMTETEPRTHKLELVPLKGGRFMGSCSCGDKSEVMTTAGMVHSWHGDHVNRFPLLTRAIVMAASKASRAAQDGKPIVARAFLDDALRMGDALRRLGWPTYREAEQTALDLLDRAASVVAQAESTRESPGEDP